MLTANVVATPPPVAVPKQITVVVSGGGTIVYTVPEGKTFVGFLQGQYGSGVTASINGVTLGLSTAASTTSDFEAPIIPITLIAGSIVRGGTGSGSLIGVES